MSFGTATASPGFGFGTATASPSPIDQTPKEAPEFSEKLLFNYCENDILKTMYNNEDFCDMSFIVDSTRIPVNRAIISAASSVFKTMLLGSFQEARSQEIKIPDIGKEGFLHFVKYIYGYGIQIDSIKLKDLLDILILSDQYDLHNLLKALKIYISTFDLKTVHNIMVSASSSIKLMNAAFTYDIHNLYEKIKAVIQYSTSLVNNFLDNPKFVCLSMPVLTDLLKSDHLITEEIVILKSVLKWIESNENSSDSPLTSGLGPTSLKKEILSSEEIVCRKKRRYSGSESLDDNTDSTNDATVSKAVGINENIKTLLNETRWSLSKYTKFSKLDPLFQKYKNFLNAFKWSDDYKPRKQLHYKQITLVCKQKTNHHHNRFGSVNQMDFNTTDTSYSFDINCDRFCIVVKYSGLQTVLVTLSQTQVKHNILDKVPYSAIKYSLILKSSHPLKNNYVLVDGKTCPLKATESTEKALILNASHPLEDNYCSSSISCAINNDKESTDEVDSTSFSTELLTSDPKFIENDNFKLEAVIQYID